MEMWDLLDADGNKTGRTVIRGQHKFEDGEYMLAVHIYIYNSKGEYLVQKRSMKKELAPGKWDITGGAVLTGEDSRTGAVREVQEELGILLDKNDMRFIIRLKRRHSFIDIWFIKADIASDEFILQEDEVDDVKFVLPDEFINTVFEDKFKNDDYKRIIEKEIYGELL